METRARGEQPQVSSPDGPAWYTYSSFTAPAPPHLSFHNSTPYSNMSVLKLLNLDDCTTCKAESHYSAFGLGKV
ncbi:hypothetical protein PoB_007474800 [Plakobranchus ocellatus]|uniref:Uncharacterized protein n=1 Tax=Plakobranchus ocellatus TaxID=259542 RepID=A0AAV4DVE3_9GAST|nr:hypothetical protein PoB_007474800 [Plakobranchus ocellatus]